MKKTKSAIIRSVVESVESEFHVCTQTDDGGLHWCIYVPWETPVKKLRDEISKLKIKKRCLTVFVPEGYIETFLRK